MLKSTRSCFPAITLPCALTGEAKTTISGLSEGMFWDFQKNEVSKMLMDHYGFSKSMIPEIVPTFSVQGEVTAEIAA
jgi:xylulokinase